MTLAEINLLSGKGLATPNKIYHDENGKVYIGTKNGRIIRFYGEVAVTKDTSNVLQSNNLGNVVSVGFAAGPGISLSGTNPIINSGVITINNTGILSLDIITVSLTDLLTFLIPGNELLQGRTYKITEVHNGLCNVYLIALSPNTFNNTGTCDYTNPLMGGGFYTGNCVYDLPTDTFIYLDLNIGGYSNIFTLDFFIKPDSLLENTNWGSGGFVQNNVFIGCQGITDPTTTSNFLYNILNGCGIYLSNSTLSNCNGVTSGITLNNLSSFGGQVINSAVNLEASIGAGNFNNCQLTLNNSTFRGEIHEKSQVTLSNLTWEDIYIGANKIINTNDTIYQNVIGKRIDGRISDFEYIANPNALGVINLNNAGLRHVGIITPNNNSASLNINTINTFDSSLDLTILYKAVVFNIIDGANISTQGVGGGNIELNNAVGKSIAVTMTKFPTGIIPNKFFVTFKAVQN